MVGREMSPVKANLPDLNWLHRSSVNLLRPAARVVPFLGAGISRAAGMPSGAELAARLIEVGTGEGVDFSRLASQDRRNCRAVADAWAGHDPSSEDRIRDIVHAELSPAEGRASPTRAQRAIAHIPSKLCLTLNYDRTVEAAARAEGISYRSLIGADLDTDTLRSIGEEEHDLYIVHLHGSLARVQSLVLTAGHYSHLNSLDRLGELFTLILYRYNVSFLGVSFDEPYLPSVFSYRAIRVPKHVFIGPGDEISKLTSGRGAVREAEHGIVSAGFPAGEWGAVDDFAEWLVRPEAAPVAEYELQPGPEPDPGYVPQRVVRRSDEESSAVLSIDIALGLVDLVDEEALAEEGRCVIQGAPGTGKTSLLRRLGECAPADELPIYVPLREVDAGGGQAEQLLSAWAARGEVLRNEKAPLGPEVFAARRFRFLFDGLDEVPHDRRAELGALIREIADALPQHKYVLAARPLEALEGFTEPPWRHFVLKARTEWREEFLASHGLALEDLLDVVEGLGANSSLLSVPFFLRTVVELHKTGGFGAVQDLRELTVRLVRTRVERDELLRLSATELVRWLARVALALTLAGRTSATLDELRRFEIAVPNAVGDLGDLVDLLVNRALLSLSGSHFAFQHRLMQEALAAEALEELGPQQQVLDAVAPRISAAVKGTRSEWTVPLEMLTARQFSWRQALRERDPRLVARTVTEDAPLDERRWAALTIWTHYLRSRTWMHDWHNPAPIQDSEVLARLLADPALSDILKEVVYALGIDQRQIRSNAIEVLGFTKWPGLLQATRELIVSDQDFVVRRHAASVARVNEFTSLFEPIKRRALEPEERSEAADMSSIAAHLAPDEELLQLAISFADGGIETEISRRQLKRLSDADRVRLMRIRTGIETEPLRSDKEEFIELVGGINRASAKTAEDVGWIATCWSITDQEVVDWLSVRDPGAVGVADALDAGRAYFYQVVPLLMAYSTRILRQVGAREELIHRVEEVRANTDIPTQGFPAGPGFEESKGETEPSLVWLLDRPAEQSDALLMRNARYFAQSAEDLSHRDRLRLRRRLGRWWRDGQLSTAVHRTSRNTYTVEGWAAAWLSYGPVIDASLRADQWAEIALFGFNVNDLHEWLQRQHSRAGERLAAELCQDQRIGAWADLLRAIPVSPSNEMLEAMIGRARRVDDAYKLSAIGERLVAANDIESLRSLAGIGSGFARGVLPFLAAAGDYDAQEKLLRRLERALRKAELPQHTEELRWLDGVEDVRLLPKVINCLRLAYPLGDETHPNVVGPLQAAIRGIGGMAAIEAYDELLKESIPGIQFVRPQRDAIAQSLLAESGRRATRALSSRTDLPLLSD